MRLDGLVNTHLTYCSSIHPGETWPEVRHNLATHLPAVKTRLSPDRPFGVGLRLSAQAAVALCAPAALDEFRSFLRDGQLYVFTINGFPYGEFGNGRIKERVYLPDWRDEARLAYTDRLARLLTALLPEGTAGSISTVPLAFRDHVTDPAVLDRMADHLIRQAARLFRLAEESGKLLTLALEPEPACCLETTSDAVGFFQRRLFGPAGIDRLRRLTGLGAADGEVVLRRHLGVCLDACHAAVEFESAADTVAIYRAAGITINKVQVSAGLKIPRGSWTPGTRQELARFEDGVYLHQVVASSPSGLTRYADLPEALAGRGNSGDPVGEEWRIHCHVPIFLDRLGPFAGTQDYLRDLCALWRQSPFTNQFEVETYTWHVLPEAYRGEDVVESICRELQWAKTQLSPAE
jgi:sugar phosphate isomerase/epimerase